MVLARLTESQVWHQPAGSMALWREVYEKDSGFCQTIQFLPVCHWYFFKLLPQCWSSEGVSFCIPCVGSFRGTAWDSRSLFHQFNSHWFCSQKLWGLILLALEPWAGRPGVGLGLLAPEIPLLNYYPPDVDVGPACCTTLPFLPLWMDVVSLIL